MTEHTHRRRTRPVEDAELIDAVYRLTPAGTSEVADLLGVSRQGADQRLRKIEDRGRIWSKKVGPTRVWIHPDHMEAPP